MIHDGVKLSRTDPRKREKKKGTIEGTERLGPPLWSRKPSEPPRKADLGSAGRPDVRTGNTRVTPPPLGRSLRPCLRPAAQGRRAEGLRLVSGGGGGVGLSSMRSASQRELGAASSSSRHHV